VVANKFLALSGESKSCKEQGDKDVETHCAYRGFESEGDVIQGEKYCTALCSQRRTSERVQSWLLEERKRETK
jgi:hypothetical protein